MLEKIIYLITALLGFITILLIGFRFNSKKHTNFYLLLFFFLSSLRFFCHGFIEIHLFYQIQRQLDLLFIISAWPLLYLYFGKLNNSHDHLKGRDLLHLITPFLIFVLFCIEDLFLKEVFSLGIKIGSFIAIAFNIGYVIATYGLIKQTIWKRNSEILIINEHNVLIAKWSKFLYAMFVVMLVRFFINLALNKDEFWFSNQNNFLWVGALLWILVYVKILYSPEFLYGYDMYHNKIKEHKKNAIVFSQIWFTSGKQVVNTQDVALKEKIDESVQNYILDIEHLALNTNLFLTENVKLENLASKLKIPKSHVKYFFKYHAKISFSDFKKIIRIQKSLSLIDEGYLKDNTLESLAAITGFSSYSPFFKSFKSITGTSPQTYYSNQHPRVLLEQAKQAHSQ